MMPKTWTITGAVLLLLGIVGVITSWSAMFSGGDGIVYMATNALLLITGAGAFCFGQWSAHRAQDGPRTEERAKC